MCKSFILSLYFLGFCLYSPIWLAIYAFVDLSWVQQRSFWYLLFVWGIFFLLCSCFILPPTIAASNVGWWPWPSRLFGLDISKPANLFLGDKDNNNGRMIKLVYEALSASFWRSCVSSTEPRARSYCLRVRARCSWIVISTLLLEAEYWDLFMFTKLAWNLSFLHPKSSYSDNLIRYYRLLF